MVYSVGSRYSRGGIAVWTLQGCATSMSTGEMILTSNIHGRGQWRGVQPIPPSILIKNIRDRFDFCPAKQHVPKYSKIRTLHDLFILVCPVQNSRVLVQNSRVLVPNSRVLADDLLAKCHWTMDKHGPDPATVSFWTDSFTIALCGTSIATPTTSGVAILNHLRYTNQLDVSYGGDDVAPSELLENSNPTGVSNSRRSLGKKGSIPSPPLRRCAYTACL